MKKKFRYSQALKITAVTDAIFTLIMTAVIFFTGIAADSNSIRNSLYLIVLLLVLPLIFISVFEILACSKIENSTEWNIYLFVISFIKILFIVITVKDMRYAILPIALSLAVLSLSLLNISNKPNLTTKAVYSSVEENIVQLNVLYKDGKISEDDYEKTRDDIKNLLS